MATTKFSLISEASIKLDRDLVQSLSDGSKEAEVFGQVYDSTLQSLFTEEDWWFATDIKEMTRIDETPSDPNYLYKFALPSDCLTWNRFMDEWGNEIHDCRPVGGSILANVDTLIVDYQRQVVEGNLSPEFKAMFVARLAYEACDALVGTKEMKALLGQEWQSKFQRAVLINQLRQGLSTPIQRRNSPLQRARRGGQFFG